MSEQKICLPEGIEVIDAPFGGFPLLLYLLRGKKTVLVDTGVYSTPEEHILPWLEKHGMTPDDINQIIITHGHHDHFGGNFKMYQIHATTHAQCQYLKAKGILKRVPHNGKLLWSIK